jgi:hypothetical protein
MFCINAEGIVISEDPVVHDIVRQDSDGYVRMKPRLDCIPKVSLRLLAFAFVQAFGFPPPGRTMNRNKDAMICWFRDREPKFHDDAAAASVFFAAVTVAPDVFRKRIFRDCTFFTGDYRNKGKDAFACIIHRAFVRAGVSPPPVVVSALASAPAPAATAAADALVAVAFALAPAPAPAATAGFDQEDDLPQWDEVEEYVW